MGSVNNIKNWYKAKVIPGDQVGKKLGFPTINLDKPSILKGKEKGVYLTQVIVSRKKYFGLAYYGPRLILGEKNDVLEIYIFNFDKAIYHYYISFSLISYIRSVMNFSNENEYKKQLKLDILSAKRIISKLPKDNIV